MSTIVVVKKKGLAAIAADTLTMWGGTKQSADYVVNHEKIIRVRGSYLALAGSTVNKLALAHYFSNEENEAQFDSVQGIFRTWLALHVALKETYFMRPGDDSDDSYEAAPMNAVIASPHGIFGVGSERVVQEFSKFFAYGSGNEYAAGAMYAAYDDPRKSAEEIARLGVQAAVEFDDGSGLPIYSYVVEQIA